MPFHHLEGSYPFRTRSPTRLVYRYSPSGRYQIGEV